MARFWAESELNQRLKFSSSCVLNIGHGTVIEFVNLYPLKSIPTAPKALHSGKQNYVGRHLHTLSRSTRSSDWVLAIQPNGCIVVWRIRNLVSEPRRSPETLRWAKMPGISCIFTFSTSRTSRCSAQDVFELFLRQPRPCRTGSRSILI